MAELSRKIKIVNPFRITKLPISLQLYLYPSIESRLLTAPLYVLYYIVQNFPLLYPKGEFIFKARGKETKIAFNVKNTQFESLYAPQMKHGYEPEVMAILDTFAPQINSFWDIGSNWGYFSLYMFSLPLFKGEVDAFEPYPPSFNDLLSTVSQAGLGEQIKCHNLALSNHVGRSSMKFQGLLQSGFAFLDEDNQSEGLFHPRATVDVTTVDKLGLTPPSFIKIDAQYHEEKIIKGARETLSKYRPFIIFENCLDFKRSSATMGPLTLLKALGYEFFFPCWKGAGRLVPTEADKDNFVSNRLVLVPLEAGERFLYRDQINILACHKSNLEMMRKLFRE